jgi:hypothetical protein
MPIASLHGLSFSGLAWTFKIATNGHTQTIIWHARPFAILNATSNCAFSFPKPVRLRGKLLKNLMSTQYTFSENMKSWHLAEDAAYSLYLHIKYYDTTPKTIKIVLPHNLNCLNSQDSEKPAPS